MPPKKKDEPAEAVGAARFGRVRNNLKMGIVGLPNVGKSSLFNLLTNQSIAAENFPFCTIEPNEARCAVPDERYDHLCAMWNPPSQYPAYLHVTDIAGLVRGAAEGAGLGNDFLSHIQAVDGVFHVVRAFDSEEVIHVDDSVDPVRDLETIQHELCAKDLAYLKRQVEQEKADVKKNPTMKLSALFVATMDKVEQLLVENRPARDAEWSTPEVEMIKLKLPQLITTKPMVYLVNLTKKDFVRKKNKWLVKIHTWIKEHGGGVMIPFSVEFEEELWGLREDEEAQKAMLDAAEGAKSAMPKMVVQVRDSRGPSDAKRDTRNPSRFASTNTRPSPVSPRLLTRSRPRISSRRAQGYKELNLIYYFTAGEKEVRCWTVYDGALAPQAAGVIHSDFERGFIKAEVVAYDDFRAFQKTKGMADVKAAGKYRQEGKTYQVKDGDIIHFQFNVSGAKKK
jgi:obg-like ATPase 1